MTYLQQQLDSKSINKIKYDVTYEEMQDLYGDFHDIIEKVFEEKEFKRIMRLIKKDKEE